MDSITKAKRLIQKSMHKFCWDIHQFNLNSNPSLQISKALDYFNIDIIFDIGANTGQFSSELRTFSYKGGIVSFEPLSNAYLALTKNSTHDPYWKVHPRTAIGSRAKERFGFEAKVGFEEGLRRTIAWYRSMT